MCVCGGGMLVGVYVPVCTDLYIICYKDLLGNSGF